MVLYTVSYVLPRFFDYDHNCYCYHFATAILYWTV